MYEFLKTCGIFGIDPATILSLNDQLKEKIRLNIEQGLNEGHIKPIMYSAVSSEATTYDAIEKLRYTNHTFEKNT